MRRVQAHGHDQRKSVEDYLTEFGYNDVLVLQLLNKSRIER